MQFLLNRSLLTKLLMLLCVFLLAFAAVTTVSASLTRERMIADRTKLRAVVEVAKGTAATLEAEVTAGRIDRAEALARFRKLLYGIRYEGSEYLFAYMLDGHVFAMGAPPQTENDDRLQFKDAKGNLLVQGFLAAARRGGGPVESWYPRGSGGEALPKRSYVAAFMPCGTW